MKLERVSNENGLWPTLVRRWEDECDRFAQDFGEYALASIPVLRVLAEETQLKNAGVYALRDGDEFPAVCQLNCSLLPGYDGKVLRLRHLLLSPRFDFADDIGIDEYVDVLAEAFAGTIEISDNEMLSEHVKFHFRSRSDREFFGAMTEALKARGSFARLQMRGAWLYASKAETRIR